MITKSDLLAVDDDYKAWLLEDSLEYEDTPILDAYTLKQDEHDLNVDEGKAMESPKQGKINNIDNKEAEYGPDL